MDEEIKEEDPTKQTTESINNSFNDIPAQL